MRKCRNWQTSKTKDLVIIAIVWVQVPSSAVSRSGGMADAQASGACSRKAVWVQVPSPAYLRLSELSGSLFYCTSQTDENRSSGGFSSEVFGRFTDRYLSGSDLKVRSSQTPIREKPDTRLEENPAVLPLVCLSKKDPRVSESPYTTLCSYASICEIASTICLCFSSTAAQRLISVSGLSPRRDSVSLELTV